MKVGFANNPKRDILEEIEWIGKNKFDFVDLFLEEDQATPERIDVEKVRNLLEEHGLEVVGHTACYLPIGSPIKSLRESAVKEITRYFRVFNELGVHLVTIHANWPIAIFSAKEGIAFQVTALRELVRGAKEHNLKLMYEPIDTQKDSVENVSAVLGQVPELLFHLDIGHSSLFGRKPEQFIKEFHLRLKHVHLNDNDRMRDLHLPMGAGSIDWRRTIKVLKRHYNGTITLEVFSRDRDYALLSREKLIRLWNIS